jgi:hypothetical protein
MKGLITIILLSTIVFFGYSSMIVSASTISAQCETFWDNIPMQGAIVSITINFENEQDKELFVYAIGIHPDWAESGQYYGTDFSNNPKKVVSYGLCSTKFTMQIPSTITAGEHSFTVGVDGIDSSGNNFSWDSSSSNVNIRASASIVPQPSTSTATPTIVPITPAPTLEIVDPTSTPVSVVLPTSDSPLITDDVDTLIVVIVVGIIAVIAVVTTLFILKARS